MFLEQFKRELLVAFRESAVADHVREHDSGELAMFGALLRHITATLWTSLPEPPSCKAKIVRQRLSSLLTPSQSSHLHLAKLLAMSGKGPGDRLAETIHSDQFASAEWSIRASVKSHAG